MRCPFFRVRGVFSQGFTLMELMISLSIIGIILVIVFGAFRIGVRAWEHGEADISDHQRQRIVLERLQRQLVSASPEKIEMTGGKKFFFQGDLNELMFISDVSLITGNKAGQVFVKYVVETDDNGLAALKIYERNVLFLNTPLKDFDTPDDAFYELLAGMDHISFRFLKVSEDRGFNWLHNWDINEDRGLPDAVQVSLQLSENQPRKHVLARIIQKAED